MHLFRIETSRLMRLQPMPPKPERGRMDSLGAMLGVPK